MNLYFDSHLHLTLKNQFSKNGNSTSPWKAIKQSDLEKGLPQLIKIFAMGTLDKMFSSQSSADMLIDSNYKLVVMPLFAPDLELVKALRSKKSFMNLLKRYKDDGFGQVLSYDRYQYLESQKNAFSIVENDINLLTKIDPFNPSRKIVYLNSKDQWDQNQANTLFVVCSLEGIHSLRSNLNDEDPNLILQDIRQNLKKVQDRGIKILMANLTHIDGINGIFSNHAYAMDGMRVKGFDEKQLRPIKKGLTSEGKKLVELLEHEKICTDIKHMSPLARFDLYEYRKEKKINTPIVSSHSGLCGIPFHSEQDSLKDYIYTAKGNKEYYQVKIGKPIKYNFDNYPAPGFNASSINLFDEDVKAIFESDGLLGISLDERVLGYTKAWKVDQNTYSANVGIINVAHNGIKHILTDTDFLSKEEYHKLGLFNSSKGKSLHKCADAEELTEMITRNSNDILHHQFNHFLNHLLHCVKLGAELDGPRGVEKMLTQIVCVGSDYDGLIEPLDISINCKKINYLKDRFIQNFEKAIIKNNLFLPQNWTIKQLADRIFFENGRDFVLKRL